MGQKTGWAVAALAGLTVAAAPAEGQGMMTYTVRKCAAAGLEKVEPELRSAAQTLFERLQAVRPADQPEGGA